MARPRKIDKNHVADNRIVFRTTDPEFKFIKYVAQKRGIPVADLVREKLDIKKWMEDEQ